ncbi:MAG: SAM-dependent methyltransferase [Pseudanabaenaceae cyanobacterium]
MVEHGSLGKLYGISAGTGDPDLITIKGWKAMRQSDIVAYPVGRIGQPTVPEVIACQFMQGHQQKLPLPLPNTPTAGIVRTAWQTATINILQYLRQGKTVAFVAEGDANFYSPFAYVLLAVKQKQPEIPVEVIPGVSAPSVAASLAGIPLTTWSDKLIIFNQLTNLSDLEDAIAWAEVVVILEVSHIYREVWQLLWRYRLLGFSHVIAMPHQHWSDLTDYPLLNLPPLSLLIVSRTDAYSLLGY